MLLTCALSLSLLAGLDHEPAAGSAPGATPRVAAEVQPEEFERTYELRGTLPAPGEFGGGELSGAAAPQRTADDGEQRVRAWEVQWQSQAQAAARLRSGWEGELRFDAERRQVVARGNGAFHEAVVALLEEIAPREYVQLNMETRLVMIEGGLLPESLELLRDRIAHSLVQRQAVAVNVEETRLLVEAARAREIQTLTAPNLTLFDGQGATVTVSAPSEDAHRDPRFEILAAGRAGVGLRVLARAVDEERVVVATRMELTGVGPEGGAVVIQRLMEIGDKHSALSASAMGDDLILMVVRPTIIRIAEVRAENAAPAEVN